MANDNNYTEYLAKKINLEKIFDELHKLVIIDGPDIDCDYNEFKEIVQNVENLEKEEQADIPYHIYSSKFNMLETEINQKYGTLRIIHLYTLKVNSLIENMDEDNYNEIYKTAISLIDKITDLINTSKGNNAILDESIKAIYNVLINEAVISKCGVLEYLIHNKNEELIRENLGTLIQNDLNSLSFQEYNDIRINYASKGLGYDYLDKEIIKKISLMSLKDKYDEYRKRKESALSYVIKTADKIAQEEEEIEEKKEESKRKIKNLRVRLNAIRAKLMALTLVPILGITGFAYLGSRVGREYKITKKTQNMISNEQIGDEETDYECTDYNYKAEIKKCSPWREEITGNGYIRDVLEFQYTSDEKLDSMDITIEDAIKMDKNKVISTETKEVLDENDSMTESEMIITETFVDKDDSLARTGPIVGITFLGILTLLFVDFIVGMSGDGDYEYFATIKRLIEDLKYRRDSLKNELNGRVTHKVYKESCEQIGERIVKFKEELSTRTSKFGDLIDGVNPDLLQNVQKYLKK